MSSIARRVKRTLLRRLTLPTLRRRSDVDWSQWVEAVDLGYLVQRIDPDAWYPMETFKRMGLAILTAIAQAVRAPCRSPSGRVSIDLVLLPPHVYLVAPGDPRLGAAMRFQVLRRGFFDYPALGRSIFHLLGWRGIDCGELRTGPHAEEACVVANAEPLLEVAGATQVKAWSFPPRAGGRVISSRPSNSSGSSHRLAAVQVEVRRGRDVRLVRGFAPVFPTVPFAVEPSELERPKEMDSSLASAGLSLRSRAQFTSVRAASALKLRVPRTLRMNSTGRP